MLARMCHVLASMLRPCVGQNVRVPECLVRVLASMLGLCVGLNVKVCVDHCRTVCVVGKWSWCI